MTSYDMPVTQRGWERFQLKISCGRAGRAGPRRTAL